VQFLGGQRSTGTELENLNSETRLEPDIHGTMVRTRKRAMQEASFRPYRRSSAPVQLLG